MCPLQLHRSFRRVTLGAVVLALAGCASAPAPAPPAPKPAPPPAAAPAPDFGEMKPIPNPEPNARPAPRSDLPAAGSRPTPRPAPTPAAPRRDPARAAQLRAQGLEQLNRGAVDRAVALLQQAKALDPDNALIKRDLERAERIGRAVKGK